MRCFAQFAIGFALIGTSLMMGFDFATEVRAEGKLAAKWTSKIDADPSKSYRLDKAHGPMMVMVASFHDAGANDGKRLGKSPIEAAQELVLEFRRMKIPAYVYEVKGKNESVKSQDSLGRDQRMKNMRVVDAVCVLAGNYKTIDDPKAQKTLKYIKQFQPTCLETGVDFTISPGRPGPLSKAFMTSNPLLSDEELESIKQSADPLLVSLNNNETFGLYENKGKFTLVVARFSGKSINVINESMEKAEGYFASGGNDLDQAAISARNLVRALRSRQPVNNDPEFKDYCRLDAYVWHDYNYSLVTVGSFESPNDPGLKKYIDMFGPKVKVTETGRQSVDYRFLPVPQEEGGLNYIPFETSMRVMTVPHAKR